MGFDSLPLADPPPRSNDSTAGSVSQPAAFLADVLGPSTVRWGKPKEADPHELAFAAAGDVHKSEQAAAPERNLLSLLDNRSPEMRAALENIQSISITRDRNNPQGYHVDGNLRQAIQLPPPNLEVGGLGP